MTPEALVGSLLANGPFVRDGAPFRLLEVQGPDAAEFLHRLCTQDVKGLGEGRLLPAAFLDNKGKLLVTCLVGKLGAGFLLEVPAELADKLAALLDRYHFTEKVTIALRPAGPCRETVGAATGGAGEGPGTIGRDGDLCVVRWQRRGVAFERRHGAAPGPAPTAAPLGAELAECLRMVAGLVRVGVESEASTLAMEADLVDHVAPDKGCYTGQEIVARIHTYGHVNRKLCLLSLPAGPGITTPEPLLDEDELPVGRVMHAVPVPGQALRLGVGYLPQDFQAPGTVLRLGGGAVVTVVR